MADETMKKRGLKNRKPLGNNVAQDLWLALDNLSKSIKRNKSGLLDEAIVLLLDAYKAEVPDGKKEIVSHLFNEEGKP